MGAEAQIIEAVRAGATIVEAAQAAGKPVASVRRWLTEGRKGGKHGEFAHAVDEARAAQRVEPGEGPMTHEEVERILTDAIRRGRSLQAVKLWLAIHPRDGQSDADDLFAEFDLPGVG